MPKILHTRSICKKHGLDSEKFCISCGKTLCNKCEKEDHAEHEILPLKEIIRQYQESVEGLIQVMKQKGELIEEQLKEKAEVEKEIHILEEKTIGEVKAYCEKMVGEISHKCEELKQEFTKEYAKIKENFAKSRENLSNISKRINSSIKIMKDELDEVKFSNDNCYSFHEREAAALEQYKALFYKNEKIISEKVEVSAPWIELPIFRPSGLSSIMARNIGKKT